MLPFLSMPRSPVFDTWPKMTTLTSWNEHAWLHEKTFSAAGNGNKQKKRNASEHVNENDEAQCGIALANDTTRQCRLGQKNSQQTIK